MLHHYFRGTGPQQSEVTAMGFEVEDSLQRIVGLKGVVGSVVMTMAGETIRSTLDTTITAQVSGFMSTLVQLSNERLKNMDPDNELNLIKMRTSKHQFVVVPDTEWLFIVVINC